MAITNRDQLIAAQAVAQRLRILKTASRTSVAGIAFSVFDLAGSPGGGTLAGSSVAAGVVPTRATLGCPVINDFSVPGGYITRFEVSNTVPCRVALYDLLWKGGAYAFNANQALTGQPGYGPRLAGDFKGVELWIEAVTAFAGNQTIQIGYTNQDGVAGRTTGAIATGVAPIVARMLRLPLQAGDTGVQSVDSVASTVATVGTFNVLVMRELCEARVRVANDQIVQGPDLTGLVRLRDTSALYMVVTPDSTATGLPEVVVDIVNG